MNRRLSYASYPCLLGLGLLGLAACDQEKFEPEAEPAAPPILIQERGLVKVGSLAPNFELLDGDGNPVTLAQYRGKVVLLNFWATWCGPCRVEMPAMETLYRGNRRQDFEILAISTDAQGVSVTRPFKESLGLTFPILHDSDFRIGVAYGARTLPMSFLVNREGMVTHRIFGARDWNSPEARTLLQTLLTQRSGDR